MAYQKRSLVLKFLIKDLKSPITTHINLISTGTLIGRWANDQTSASIMFSADESNYLAKLYAQVGSDGQLRIGAFSRNNQSQCWTCFDNFHLYHLGTDSQHAEDTGISEMENGEWKIENYYDLSGRKLSSQKRGIVIVNGKKFVKR